MKLSLLLPLLVAVFSLTRGQRVSQNVRRPSFSRVNSRPVVIRLPARRPRIRPLPTFPPENGANAEEPVVTVTPIPPPVRYRRPSLGQQTPRVRPVQPSNRRQPPPAPAPPAPEVPTVPVPTLNPSQLSQILGLAGLNGQPRLPGAGGSQNLPDLSALASALASGQAANAQPNGHGPLDPPPPGTFGSGPGPFAPPPFAPPTDVNQPLPANVGNNAQGILGVLQTLTKQFTESTGLANLLPKGEKDPSGGIQLVPGIPGLSQLFSGGAGGPPVAGFPRIPGINLDGLAGGLAPNEDGNVDLANVISTVSSRFSNGSSLSELIPPAQVQNLAENITEALLPETPEVELGKFMGRWFEGINSPRDSDQRCVVHHYGGLTKNGKTATFTALKIYREGSEFGQVRYSIGYAFRGGHRQAMLQMHSSETTEPSPFWIYKVGPEGKDHFGNTQYEYAIVSNWVRYPVTVLVRDPDRFKEVHEEQVLRWLEDQGFINGFVRAFNLLQPVTYDNCQYADSTFQVFGK